MSEIQSDQNNNNNINDNKKEEVDSKEEKTEKELIKEIRETKMKLYQLYGQQWKLKAQKYKEWKEKQQEKNSDSNDSNNNDHKKECGQRKPCHRWGYHGCKWGVWDQYPPYYRWCQFSQQQQPYYDRCEQRRCCKHQCKCEKKNGEEIKPNQNAQKECKRRCHPHRHCQPYWMWWHCTQNKCQMNQQEHPYYQSQCPNWHQFEKPEQCSKTCQSVCGECTKRPRCCHLSSPDARWWFWVQRQKQMQQQHQESTYSNWWPYEGRKRCMIPNQLPYLESQRRHHYHHHIPPNWRLWFWEKGKDKCSSSNNNNQTGGDVKDNHKCHKYAIHHMENGKKDANIIQSFHCPIFGGLEQKDIDK